MIPTRRFFLKSLAALVLALRQDVARAESNARPHDVGDALAQAMERETAGLRPLESDEIRLEAPDVAEDGALVPIAVDCEMSGVESIWVFVEKNPNPLAARFDIDGSLDPFVSLRIKMNESCDVIAMIKSGKVFYSARKKVRVLLGGCG